MPTLISVMSDYDMLSDDDQEKSKEQACVPCAVNRDKKSIAVVTNLGVLSKKAIHGGIDKVPEQLLPRLEQRLQLLQGRRGSKEQYGNILTCPLSIRCRNFADRPVIPALVA